MNNDFNFQPSASDSMMNSPNFNNNEPPKPKNIFAAFSLVAGILSLIGCCILPVVGLILGVIGIVLFIVDKVVNGKCQGMAIAGLVCSIIAVVFSIVSLVIIAAFASAIEELTTTFSF